MSQFPPCVDKKPIVMFGFKKAMASYIDDDLSWRVEEYFDNSSFLVTTWSSSASEMSTL